MASGGRSAARVVCALAVPMVLALVLVQATVFIGLASSQLS
jgi:hypothetical protein